MQINEAVHLYGRAGFGLPVSQWPKLRPATRKDAILALFQESKTWKPLPEPGGTGTETRRQLKQKIKAGQLDKAEVRQLLKANNRERQKININWMNMMVEGKGLLREKMALFWHNHFACRFQEAAMAHQYLEVLRTHALGSFRDLLLAISQSPGMLLFLNNQQNRKDRPNENFAREVMELFTLGRGVYTETDVKEAARAFTGWAMDRETLKFRFEERHHDRGTKTILGQTGNWKGEDVLRILLEQPACALWICRKLYRQWVNPVPDEVQIQVMAKRFRESNYQIGDLVQTLLDSDHFFAEENRGSLIKSPVELLVQSARVLGFERLEPATALTGQRLLGQILLFPPNVAGWPGDKAWIDSASLLLRMQVPQFLQKPGRLGARVKDDGDVNGLGGSEEETNLAEARPDQIWTEWQKTGLPPDQTHAEQFLLARKLSPHTHSVLQKRNPDPGSPAAWLSLLNDVMSCPEFQLC
jgi:uncharacterized protein (DUF1800 family)